MLPLLARYEISTPTHTPSLMETTSERIFTPSTRTIHTTSSLKLFNCDMEMCCAAASYRQKGWAVGCAYQQKEKSCFPRVQSGRWLFPCFFSLSQFRLAGSHLLFLLTGAIMILSRSDRSLGVILRSTAVHP